VSEVSSASVNPASSERIVSLDQFRGYTVAGMFLVNFIGRFKESVHPILLHHNTYCSYADVVMPQFLFAVGFALRLVMVRQVERNGMRAAMGRGVRRSLGLILFGCVFYTLDGNYKTWASLQELGVIGFFTESFFREPFQALTHIGVTSLWVLPVIALRLRWVVVFAVVSGLLHVLLSHVFWYDMVFRGDSKGIDGGMLGFLTWTVCVAAGAAAYEFRKKGAVESLRPLLLWGAGLMLAGYAVSCIGVGGPLSPAPFWPAATDADGNAIVDMWTMSQRAGSLSYLTFAAGFSLLSLALFVVISDLKNVRVGLFTDLGQNAFAAYVIHLIVMIAWSEFGPRDAPLWYAVAYTLSGCVLAWLATRWCNQRGLFFRL
jgi:predicted acyltransferase